MRKKSHCKNQLSGRYILLVFIGLSLTGCVAVTDDVPGPTQPITPRPPQEEPKKPSEKYLGDWVLKSVEGNTSCTVKLQRLQGYGWGQTFNNGCYRFDNIPKIASWRLDDDLVLLQTSFGAETVGRLRVIDDNTFRGRLVSGERVRMTRK